MLLGLGFALAALISLFVARGLWHYALRLGGCARSGQLPPPWRSCSPTATACAPNMPC